MDVCSPRRRSVFPAHAWLLTLCVLGWPAQAQGTDEYDLKATFLISVSKFVTWPESSFRQTNDDFVIGIVGKDPFGVYIDRFAGKSIVVDGVSRRILIKRFRDIKDLTPTHVLFVSPELSTRTREVLDAVGKDSTLLVGDDPAFAQTGGIIGLYVRAKKIRFDVNQKEAKGRGIAIRSNVLKMATEVIR
jgi:hypothetical protein